MRVNTRYKNSIRGSSSIEFRRVQEDGGDLDSQEEASPEEIKSREVVLGYRERVGLLLLQLFPNGGATDIVTLFCIAVGTAIAWCGGRCAMQDGHCLIILLFWRRSTAASVFRVGACFGVSLFCPPFPLVPDPNRPAACKETEDLMTTEVVKMMMMVMTTMMIIPHT